MTVSPCQCVLSVCSVSAERERERADWVGHVDIVPLHTCSYQVVHSLYVC